MEDPNSTLLPYILERLSQKPELCDTFDHICREIEEQLIADNNTRYGNVSSALQRALMIGQSLGIITLTNETIRMPFNFRANAAKKEKNATMANHQVQQLGTGNPIAQITNAKNIIRSKKPNRKLPNDFDTPPGNPDFTLGPPRRSRKVRGRPRGPSCARQSAGGRNYSLSRSGRGYKRPRSGFGGQD
ncbi:PREDICTED: uncharacterized protein LOC108360150 [Rhagoletis zephyria]|uniref:uncharacterized protein LOC108360150 n=1 Tax=Rhagoletis zephyria TaxID=28612 RepID=UPI00081175BA|nr:PREDICTED: uncharacterized protein LOC108360150 [Rhagoletis zephyria]XP_036322487.1 uncharacterized protein LOC118736531 [Rhagoletis pomonella]